MIPSAGYGVGSGSAASSNTNMLLTNGTLIHVIVAAMAFTPMWLYTRSLDQLRSSTGCGAKIVYTALVKSELVRCLTQDGIQPPPGNLSQLVSLALKRKWNSQHQSHFRFPTKLKSQRIHSLVQGPILRLDSTMG